LKPFQVKRSGETRTLRVLVSRNACHWRDERDRARLYSHRCLLVFARAARSQATEFFRCHAED
jgi:hypothetical protein